MNAGAQFPFSIHSVQDVSQGTDATTLKMHFHLREISLDRPPTDTADVCLLVNSEYPHVDNDG